MCVATQMVLNPLGYVSRQVGGPFGTLLDPLATLGEKIGGIPGAIIDPARGLDKAMKSKSAPQPERSPAKSPEDINREARDRILKSQQEERQKKAGLQPSLLQSIQDQAGDIAGTKGVAGGTQKLDSVIAKGERGLLS